MKNFLVTICVLASGTAAAGDDVYDCIPVNSDEHIQIVHYGGQNVGHITREGFDRDVMAFHGLESMTFVVLGEDFAHTETYTVDLVDHHFTAMHGAREEHGQCEVHEEFNEWNDAASSDGDTAHSHY